MKTSGNVVLITGGGTGIGLALAEALMREGNDVMICGRREEKLREAAERLPGVHIRRCDVADMAERRALMDWVTGNFPGFNILVNNAGIQREIDFTRGEEDLAGQEDEIVINLQAPARLSALAIPALKKQGTAAIVNISSGLGFIPIARMPLYCATKAAIHSFSLSLRHQLNKTPVRVFEVIPPTVDTGLDRGARERRGQKDRGISAEEVAVATMQALKEDQFEAAIGRARDLRSGSRTDPDRLFQMLNG